MFSREANLKKHVDVIHNNIRNFKCTLCPKAYASYADVKKHIVNNHCKNFDVNLQQYIKVKKDS